MGFISLSYGANASFDCSECAAQCWEDYTTLNDEWRNVDNYDASIRRASWGQTFNVTLHGHADISSGTVEMYGGHSDFDWNEGWYRFNGSAGDALPRQSPGKRHCGMYAVGWLSSCSGHNGHCSSPGRYPDVRDGVQRATVCFDYTSYNPCSYNVREAKVVNCGSFLLWYLPAFPYLGSVIGGYCTTSSGLFSAPTTLHNFSLVVLNERAMTGVQYADPAWCRFMARQVYKIAPLKIDASQTEVSSGSALDITYELRNAPSSWSVSKSTGVMTGWFPSEGQYNFSIWALDKSRQEALMETLWFAVEEDNTRVTFRLFLLQPRARTHVGVGYTDPDVSTNYTVGQVYTIAPYRIDTDRTVVGNGSVSDITYDLTEAPDTWSVSTTTGIMSGVFNEVGLWEMALWAVDESGQRELVEALTFRVLPSP
eukprot:CAMPEP_0185529344 /NCGR_PEP_ID=MMETSP1366-20130426/101170_1 /TAXON_ID=38817 /ORGANISM="Gephyrocapsa oceanica, Strain RCC1303" /LENGTH=424 /DNA_ID=CAMNT_0028140957 /DNA_START=1 /DNA_END=1271 /DNA_ORIENTATION=+